MKYIVFLVFWIIYAILYFIWNFQFVEFPKDIFEDDNYGSDSYDTGPW